MAGNRCLVAATQEKSKTNFPAKTLSYREDSLRATKLVASYWGGAVEVQLSGGFGELSTYIDDCSLI